MTAASVVMSNPLLEKPPKVSFVDRNQEIQALATNGSDQAFAWGARKGVFKMLRPLLSAPNPTRRSKRDPWYLSRSFDLSTVAPGGISKIAEMSGCARRGGI
jgi:hypothetical protein